MLFVNLPKLRYRGTTGPLAKSQKPATGSVSHDFTQSDRREAESLRKDIEATIRGIREAEESIATALSRWFDGVPGESREKLCWRAIAWYANADLETVDQAGVKLQYLLKLILGEICGSLIGDGLSEFNDLAGRVRIEGCSLEDALLALAKGYQTEFRQLLTWLSSPNKNGNLADPAVAFLFDHVNLSLLEADANPEFDENGNQGLPYFYVLTGIHCPTLITPLCKFIFDHIERYQQEEISLREAIPVLKCKRPECGRFMFAERPGRKEYCSDLCRAQRRRVALTASGEQREYVWLHRLEWSKQAELDLKLRKPKTLERLRRIEKEWPKLAARARELLERASKLDFVKKQDPNQTKA